jgi:hypothetical protein
MKRIRNVGALCLFWLTTLVANVNDNPDHLDRMVDDYQLASYQEDGFIVMKGVLDDNLVDRMAEAARAIVERAVKYPQFFSVIENGLIFNGGGHAAFAKEIDKVKDSNDEPVDTTSVFRNVALYSNIPQIAAELMELDSQTQNLRILRYVKFLFIFADISSID